MKKLVFKKWVEYLLIIITFIALIGASADCEDLKVFTIKTIICGLIVAVNATLLLKYGRD